MTLHLVLRAEPIGPANPEFAGSGTDGVVCVVPAHPPRQDQPMGSAGGAVAAITADMLHALECDAPLCVEASAQFLESLAMWRRNGARIVLPKEGR